MLVQRPPRSSRLYALFNLIVFVVLMMALVAFIHFLTHLLATRGSTLNGASPLNLNVQAESGSFADLTLRELVVIPHQIALIFVGIVAGVLWLVVQWVILVTGRFPEGMYNIVAGYLRWSTRVTAYKFGLTDRYPRFTMQPSLAAPGAGGSIAASGPADWPQPPEPAPPATGYRPAPPPLPPAPSPFQPPAPPSAPWPPGSLP